MGGGEGVHWGTWLSYGYWRGGKYATCIWGKKGKLKGGKVTRGCGGGMGMGEGEGMRKDARALGSLCDNTHRTRYVFDTITL